MAEEKKGMLDRFKSSRLGKALFFAGAMTAASFGMADKAEAAEQKEQINVTMKNVHVMPGAQIQSPAQEYAQLTGQLTQLARQKMVYERTGNIEKASAIQKQMENINMQRAILAKQIADQQKSQTQSQPQVEQNQNEVQNEKEAFEESLKVPPRMSDEEFKKIYQEAVTKGDKTITNPEWIKELQLRRQEAAMKKFQERQSKAQENREQGQEIGG